MKTTNSLIALTLCAGFIGGCPPREKSVPDGESTDQPLKGRADKPPVLPALGPVRVNTPIDGSLRAKAISELNKAFATNDPILRANAIEGMQRGLGAVAGDRIKKGLVDPSPLVRFASAMAAGTVKLDEAKPILLSMVDDPDTNVEVGVRYALHRLGEYKYSHDLEEFARNTSPQVRANVVIVFGLLGDKSALKILRALEADQSNLVKVQLLESEYRLNDETAAQRLYALSLSNYPDERILCLLGLGAKKDPGVTRFLEGQLVADWPEVSLAAARSLGMVGVDTGYGVVVNYYNSKDARQRGMAALAFGEIGRTDSQKYLSRLLTDDIPSVRIAAATAILQLRN